MGVYHDLLQRILVQQLRSRDVGDDMVHINVGPVDVVVWTRPECLIEVKVVLDPRELDDAIEKLMRYSKDYPAAQLFIFYAEMHKGLDRKEAMKRIEQRRISFWNSHVAEDVAEECRKIQAASPHLPTQRRHRPVPLPSEAEVEKFHSYVARLAHHSYRTDRRVLAGEEALMWLPAGDRDAAGQVLAQLGRMKAEILAPALKSDPNRWRDILENARGLTVKRLQRKVSRTVGAKPRGRDRRQGDLFYRQLLDALPVDHRIEVHDVFGLAFLATGSKDPVVAFMRIVREARKNLKAPGLGEA